MGSPLLLSVQLFTQYLYKSLVYSLEEVLGVHLLLVLKCGEQVKVACHNAVLDSLYSSLFKSIGKVHKLGQLVQLASLSECACPRKQRSYRSS